MRSFIIFAAIAVCATAYADAKKRPKSVTRASEAVLRVSIGTVGTENASGIVVSKEEAFVLTTATFVARCPENCVLTVHDDGQKEVSRIATIVAIDAGHNLALLRTDGPLPNEVVFGRAARNGQPLSTYAYTFNFGRTAWSGKIDGQSRVRYQPEEGGREMSWENVYLIEKLPEPGAIGAGAFGSDGRLLGMVVGKTMSTVGELTTDRGVIIPSSALIAFLEANGVQR